MKRSQDVNLGEYQLQKKLLNSAVGTTGSGYDRYAAAMYFNRQGILSNQLLEIYRRCCKRDNEDPIKLAVFEGVSVDLEGEVLDQNQG